MPRPCTRFRRVALAPVRRVLAVLVLTGYALVLAGSSVGRGWTLLVHLVSEHHEAEALAAHAPTPHPHSGSGHAHGGHDGDTPHDHDASVTSRHAPHEHDGRTHTHENERDTDPDAPAVLTVALDKHCLFSGAALTPPPVHNRDDVRPDTVLFSTVPPVEVPPPRALS